MSLKVAPDLRRVYSDSELAEEHGNGEIANSSSKPVYDSERMASRFTPEPEGKSKKKHGKGFLRKIGLKKKKKLDNDGGAVLSHSFDGKLLTRYPISEPGIPHSFSISQGSPHKGLAYHHTNGQGEDLLLDRFSSARSSSSSHSSTSNKVTSSLDRTKGILYNSDDSFREEVPAVRVQRPSCCHSAPVSPMSSANCTPNQSPLLERKESSLSESHRMPLSSSQLSLVAPPGHMFGVHITLIEGLRLAVRDRGGTSDPYVKFRLGEQKYKSRTVMKDLNPKWNESFILWTSNIQEQLKIKVYDYDRGWTDDYMGGVDIDLTMFPLNKPIRRLLKLEDHSSLEENLGCLLVSIEITTEEMSPEGLEMVQGVTSTRKTKRPVMVSKLRQWSSILTVALLRGVSLPAVDVSDSHPYCKFKMGSQRYKSKVLHRTANPEWKEQFDLRLYEGESQTLHLEVWDRVLRKKDKFMGSCSVDLSKLNIEVTQELLLDLEEGEGKIHVLLTISGHSEDVWSEDSGDCVAVPQAGASAVDWAEVRKKYSLLNSAKAIKDVGFLQVKVEKAMNLVSQRHSGCDPVAVLEVGNTQVRTTTLSKTSNPVWNKTFNIHIKDIHETLDITVYSGDSAKGSEFIGMVTIPLLRLVEGPQSYMLKDKTCLQQVGRAEIFLECSMVYNPVRASLRTINPREVKALHQPDKLQSKVLLSNVRRVANLVRYVLTVLQFLNSVFSWENKVLSTVSLLGFIYGCLFFEYWMPFALLAAVFIGQHLRMTTLPRSWNRQPFVFTTDTTSESDPSDSDEEWEEETTQSLSQKLRRLQEVLTTTQHVIGFIADLGERVKNLFYWSVPFCCWLAIAALLAAAGVLYVVPPRFIILLWGLNKFSKKLRNPNYIPNNELLDFLSRIPTDKQLMQWENGVRKINKAAKKKNKKKQL